MSGRALPASEGPSVAETPASDEGLLLLLAHPAGHSVSPAMQQAALDALGVRARYRARDVPPADLPAVLQAMRAPPYLGGNVTVPHKERVFALLDGCSDLAKRLGAVNTLVRRGDRLWGENTDVVGFERALSEIGVELRGLPVVVLGAGGAARAVVAALATAGARIALHNRSGARAAALLAALAPTGRLLEGAAELAEAVRAAHLVVQTTSVGMVGAAAGSPLPEGLLPRTGAVVDLIYRPAETPLLAAAAAAGLATQNGLPMLLHQGAAAFTAWTGEVAPLAVMRAAAEGALLGGGAP
jgi:shikimate dehydrogenase